MITRLYYQHPSVYTALAERYDPAGDYTRNFEDWFDEQNAVKPRPPIPQDPTQDRGNFGDQWILNTSKAAGIHFDFSRTFPAFRIHWFAINVKCHKFHLAVSADTSDVKFTKTSPAESSSGPTTSANEVSSTQQAVRRSPNIIDSGVQRIPNKVPTDRPRTRIPSTWITSSTTTTTPRSTSTRAPLRTSYPTVRAPTVRSPPATYRPVS